MTGMKNGIFISHNQTEVLPACSVKFLIFVRVCVCVELIVACAFCKILFLNTFISNKTFQIYKYL